MCTGRKACSSNPEGGHDGDNVTSSHYTTPHPCRLHPQSTHLEMNSVLENSRPAQWWILGRGAGGFGPSQSYWPRFIDSVTGTETAMLSTSAPALVEPTALIGSFLQISYALYGQITLVFQKRP